MRRGQRARRNAEGKGKRQPQAEVDVAPITISAQVVSEKDKSEKQASTKPAEEKPKSKFHGNRSSYMQFFFESIYQIVTWVCIALSIGFFLLFYSQQNWKGTLWSGCALLCSIIVMLTLLAQRYFPAFGGGVETDLHGVLTPATERPPAHPCDEPVERFLQRIQEPVSPDAVSLHYGKSGCFLNKVDRFVVIKVGNEELLSVSKSVEGLSISAKVYSPDFRIVAEIKDNEFFINPNNYFRIERKDRHTLVVYDQQATKVLDVHFLNSRTASILAVFHHPNVNPIVITDERVTVGGAIFNSWCSMDSNVGISVG